MISKLLLYVTQFVLCGYIIVLINRTNFLKNGTSIGFDVILAFHLIEATVIITSIYLLYKINTKDILCKIILIIALISELIFFMLNFFGIVWKYEKGSPFGILAYIKQFFY
jgi:uncharacterized membrane protein (DUF485 family)